MKAYIKFHFIFFQLGQKSSKNRSGQNLTYLQKTSNSAWGTF